MNDPAPFIQAVRDWLAEHERALTYWDALRHEAEGFRQRLRAPLAILEAVPESKNARREVEQLKGQLRLITKQIEAQERALAKLKASRPTWEDFDAQEQSA
jgi:hypothetical protein